MKTFRVKTSIEGLLVSISETIKDNGKISIRGYAYDKKSNRKLTNIKEVKRIAQNEDDKDVVIDTVVAEIEKRYRSRILAKRRQKISRFEDSPIIEAYFEFLNFINSCPYSIFEGWNAATLRANLSLFEHKILLLLVPYVGGNAKPFTTDSQKMIENEILRGVMNHGNCRKNRIIAMRTVAKILSASQRIYDTISQANSELPKLVLTGSPIPKRIRREQIKALPPQVRQTFFKLVWHLTESEPLLAMHIAIMADAALRTAEAAAVIPSIDIDFQDDFGVIHVEFQEKDGLRNPILKSSAAYRNALLSYWGKTMVQRCSHFLGDNYIIDEKVAPIRASVISAAVKQLLLAAGLEEALWNEFEYEEVENPERDDNDRPVYDIVAYILRRDRATVLQHICNLSEIDVDYLLGHKNDVAKSKKAEYRLSSVQAALAKKLERFVVDPLVTRHAGIVPIKLFNQSAGKIIPFEKFRLQSNENVPIKVYLDISTAVPGENVKIVIPKSAKMFDINPSSHRVEDNFPMNVIGHTILDKSDKGRDSK